MGPDRRIMFLKDRHPPACDHDDAIMYAYTQWFQRQTVRAPPSIPMTPERVVRALRNDPPLLWAVMQQLREERVLAPWGNCGLDWQGRKDSEGFTVAIVRPEDRPGLKPWRWDTLNKGASYPPSQGDGWYDTAEEACAACDARLIESGWMLA